MKLVSWLFETEEQEYGYKTLLSFVVRLLLMAIMLVGFVLALDIIFATYKYLSSMIGG